MKTKIRTFISVCILAFVGLNANATETRLNLRNSLTFEDEKNARSLKADENVEILNGKTETIETSNAAIIDYQKEAESLIKSIADREEEKTIELLKEKMGENLASGNVFERSAELDEAQLVTRMIADREEARAIQKLMDNGNL